MCIRDRERGILWNDPKVGIEWPLEGIALQLHPRDAGFPALNRALEKDLPAYPS